MIEYGRDVCGDLNTAVKKEWLETNGLGGYACGTIAGLNTRGYHSLLTVPIKPPLKRSVLVSQVSETFLYHGKKYELSTVEYTNGQLQPQGYTYLEAFKLNPFPTFYYRLADQLLEKQLFMFYGQSETWMRYRLLTKPSGPVVLSIKPLLSFRSHHLQKRGRLFVNTHHDLDQHVIKILPDHHMPSVFLYHNANGYEHSAHWFQQVAYREEQARKLEGSEDLFTPGMLTFDLHLVPESTLTISTEAIAKPDYHKTMKKERQRREGLVKLLPTKDTFGRTLMRAADHFLVKREQGLSVMAGYPWLSDCGRDAMIACAGLTVATKRYDDAKQLLATFAGYCSEGMFPNLFSEQNSEPRYNTVDAALWFFLAVDYYFQQTQDQAFIRETCWVTMVEVVNAYSTGTRFGIRMDTDGLINLGEEGAQLTWMDAQVGDWVVTPRAGKTVEINALWYNCLCIMVDYADKLGEIKEVDRYRRMAANTRAGFKQVFWDEERQCLFDRVEDYYQDKSIRPNQLFAVSLPYPLLEGEEAEAVLKQVMEKLYTTFGCRTLSTDDPHYRGYYAGDLLKREGAAFQGTVWPWLVGAVADAWRAVYGDNDDTRQTIDSMLKPFELHLAQTGLGLISEMFDGNEPHLARGCIARAWNIAEILRVHLEWRGPNNLSKLD